MFFSSSLAIHKP